MALRFASKAQNAASIGGGGVVTHGLGATPDEYWLAQHGASVPNFIAASTPDTTAVYVTVAAGGVVSVFAAVNHSIIK
jgi:hypothetical protein